ncbi:MAG: long-chain fatty acid--CoA ligase [Promethearchaeota archaeon]|nr:MAG: long-chain fatty acid--CoA ligase [Candidatus Lokiarchaeota archaeon]
MGEQDEVVRHWDQFWPEGTPKTIDYKIRSVGDILRNTAQEFPDSDAIYFEGWRCTYKELDLMADQFATALAKLGVKKGDIVAIDTPNIPQFIIAFYALQRLGATVNPIIPLHKYVEIVYQVNDSNSKLLIILDVLYEGYLHGKDLSKMKSLEGIILTGVGEYLPKIKAVLGKALGKVPRMKVWPTGKVNNIPIYSFQELLESGTPINVPSVSIDPKKDIATLIYTGGTTGVPKGVMLSHYNLSANAEQGISWIESQLPETRDLHGKGGVGLVVPFAHVFGISTGMSLGVTAGYKLILFPQPPEKKSVILKVLMKEGGTYIPGVPTLWNLINQDPDSAKLKGKLTTLKACISGGAPLPPEVKKKFEDLTGALIIEGYGLSETSPNLVCSPFHRSKPNAVGFPLADTLVKIVDIDDGKTILPKCPDDNTDDPKYLGEICACGPQIMVGYLGKEEDTKFALRKDSKGRTWLYTADIGCFDKEGYLMIKDRKRDMIKYKGHGVFPAEVEKLIYMNDAVNEVGVIGVPHPEGVGETIKAYISIKEEYKGKVTKEDLMEWCQENISPYKYPRIIEIIDELPKTLVGKILRRELRELEE